MSKPSYLYSDYLRDEAAYSDAELFWETLFNDLSDGSALASDWATFGSASTYLGNGEVWHPVYEAREFNALSPILRKVRANPNKLIFVTQVEGPQPPDEEITASGWISATTGIGNWDTGYTTGDVWELRIFILLTEDILPEVKSCILYWMRNDTSIDDMKDFLMQNERWN